MTSTSRKKDENPYKFCFSLINASFSIFLLAMPWPAWSGLVTMIHISISDLRQATKERLNLPLGIANDDAERKGGRKHLGNVFKDAMIMNYYNWMVRSIT